MTTRNPIARITDRDQVESLVKTDLPPEDKAKVLDIITNSHAILEGHFAFRDCHSQHLFRFRSICDFDYFAQLLVEQAGIDPDEETPLKVISPESAGFLLSHDIARMFVCNKNNAFKKLVLARVDFMDRKPVDSFVLGKINPGNCVVVVNDIDRTGESLDRMIKTVRRHDAKVEAVLVFAVCNEAEHKRRMKDLGVKSYYLAEFNLQTSDKDNCKMCENGVDVDPVSTLV